MRGRPDFIIVGAMKCATTTLHAQLAAQAGIYMAGKQDEPSFFSDDERYARGAGWYASLFEGAAPGQLCGESSTHYTMLPTYPETVRRMRAHLDDVRLIYLMRHPVERLISHFIHDWSQGLVEARIDEAVDRHPVLTAYGRYAMQLDPFLAEYGRERVLPVFFERLVAFPQQEFERVCRFIGLSEKPAWQAHLARLNVSAERLRRSKVRDGVVNAPLIGTLRRRLVPRSLRESVKRLWVMDKRPRLSGPVHDRVRHIFDEDLARLGSWLGMPLSCDTFETTARSGAHEWKGAPAGAVAGT